MKQIVAAVDGSVMSLVALHYGAEIARRVGARVRVVFVKDIKLLESGALARGPAHETLEAAVAAEAEAALGRARDRCGRLGVVTETVVRRGVVPVVLCEEAREADLLTMGRWGEHALWATGLLGSAVECVVRKVQRPVLVASGPYEAPRRALVAFDGSAHARTALALGIEVAERIGLPLALLTVGDDPARRAAALDEAAAACEAAGLRPVRLSNKGEPAAEIASEASPETLVFMGAYGHSPMRELVLGSVTEQVMRAARGPIVLCRGARER
jgi:nucleotide-binding universal stress UspA family protein